MPLEMKCSLPVLVSFLFVNWTNIIFTSIRAEIFTQYDCGYHYIQYLTLVDNFRYCCLVAIIGFSLLCISSLLTVLGHLIRLSSTIR